MPNYLHVVQGVIAGAFPWSMRIYSTSAATESVAQTNWNSGISAMFNTAAFFAMLPTGTNVTNSYTSTMDSNWKQTTKTSTTLAINGTATQALPYHVSEVITFRTAKATKYGRGRWYLPALATTALATAGGTLSATAVGNIVSAWNTGQGQWRGTLQFVLLHRRGTKGGVPALSTDNIITGDVPNGLDTQRRRADKFTPTRSALTF